MHNFRRLILFIFLFFIAVVCGYCGGCHELGYYEISDSDGTVVHVFCFQYEYYSRSDEILCNKAAKYAFDIYVDNAEIYRDLDLGVDCLTDIKSIRKNVDRMMDDLYPRNFKIKEVYSITDRNQRKMLQYIMKTRGYIPKKNLSRSYGEKQ